MAAAGSRGRFNQCGSAAAPGTKLTVGSGTGDRTDPMRESTVELGERKRERERMDSEDGAAQWGKGVRHYGCNLPLLKYCTGLTQPAFDEATCHNRETPPRGRSAPQQNGACGSRADPR
ncbi:hypothetical protein P7K49_007502 [Saguinus oedipus]|uniref:Uncharacterized protein n=1 Tax=Saguinus oedipus TaxID=9490 RepID=A0ABQ9VV23_SAGOE|nr:hypothetical protein P7K49_007502 [Saguinus oedipus]